MDGNVYVCNMYPYLVGFIFRRKSHDCILNNPLLSFYSFQVLYNIDISEINSRFIITELFQTKISFHLLFLLLSFLTRLINDAMLLKKILKCNIEGH